MLKIFLISLISFLFNIYCYSKQINRPLKTTHRFPCEKSDVPETRGYCVPKRECCSEKHWHYNKYDHGDCHFDQFCCTVDVLCQNCPNGTRDVMDSCVDINECKERYGLCSGHHCLNTNGSYTCACFNGYQLIDEIKTCRPVNHSSDIYLLFSASLTINTIKFNEFVSNDRKNKNIFNDRNIRMVYSGTVTPQSIDYSFTGNYMAWTDSTLDQINMAPIISEQPSLVMDRVVLTFTRKPYSLAIDWIHDLLYWTDLETRTINVVNVKKSYESYVVINNTNQEPRDLLVNVLNSTLVWTHIGLKPRIMRSFQDGSNQTVLYSTAKQTFCLTIDTFIKRYYFLDLDFTLNSIDFDGKDERKIFVSQNLLSGVNSMSVYYDNIFISTNSLIYKINKFGHFDRRLGEKAVALVSSIAQNADNQSFFAQNIIQSHRQQLFNVKIIDTKVQPKLENKCQFSKCSHICLPSDPSHIFRCVCPVNQILVDERVCTEKKFETLVIETLFWEKDLQKLIEHSIIKSNSLRKLLNQSFEQNLSLKELFGNDNKESEKLRQIFSLTSKQNYEMKKTLIETINETVFWRTLLNITFNNKNRFEKFLNHSIHTNNLTEILNFLTELTDEDKPPESGIRIGEIILLILILVSILIIIIVLIYIGYKFKSYLKNNSNNSSQIYSSQCYRKPIYQRPHEIESKT